MKHKPIILLLCSLIPIHSWSMQPPVAIVGCGYVGLTLAAILSQQNQAIICIDTDEVRITQLQNNIIPIYEPGLRELLFSGNSIISFTTHLADACNAHIYYVCVPTPTDNQKRCVYTWLYEAFDNIVAQCADDALIVIKSTIPPGTMNALYARIPDQQKQSLRLVYNPEFMREGCALHDIYTNNPIVLGTQSSHDAQKVKDLYTSILKNPAITCITTDFETAELIKYSWNAFSALRITFINELAFLSKECGADIATLIKGISLSETLLPTNTIKPGPGFGGSCFPKDIASFAHIMEEHGAPQSLVHQIITSNESHKKRIINNILHFKPQTVTLLGLSFKANTNDIRNSPAIDIIKELINHHITIKAYDPRAIPSMKSLFPTVHYYDSPYDASQDTDCIVVLTEWQEIKDLNVAILASRCAKKIMLDTRQLFNKELMNLYGFIYQTW